MNTVMALFLLLSAGQGEALLAELPAEPGLAGASLAWNDAQIPLVRRDDRWIAVIGVDLDVAPGEHPAEFVLTYADGRSRRIADTVTVKRREFPTKRLTVEPKYVELSPENRARADREREEIDRIYRTVTPEAYWTDPFAVPIPGQRDGRNFGQRRVFNDQPRAPHSGADLTATTGTPVLATNRGRVVLAKDLFFSGNAVFLDHGLGLYSVYLHLSAIDVAPGQMVEQGEVVGRAGATGRVTGPHLHWGVRAQNARVDPFSLLQLAP